MQHPGEHMITLRLNNTEMTLPNETTLETLLNNHGYANKGFAVAINKRFIPKTNYPTTQLQQNDIVEIITPMQGG